MDESPLALTPIANTSPAASPAMLSISSTSLIPKMAQRMIVNAFSTLGLSGKTKTSTSAWYLDSGASNHMTYSSKNLSHMRNYDGNLGINTVDGGGIPITVVGNSPHFLPLNHVFLSLQLTKIYCPFATLSIMPTLSLFLVLVMLCRIKCRGR